MRRPPARRRHQRCAGAGAPQAAALPAVSARVPTRGHGAPGACRASTTSCLLTPEDDVYPQQACLPGRVPGPAHLSSQAAQRTAVGLQHERARALTCGRRRAPQQEVLCRAGELGDVGLYVQGGATWSAPAEKMALPVCAVSKVVATSWLRPPIMECVPPVTPITLWAVVSCCTFRWQHVNTWQPTQAVKQLACLDTPSFPQGVN